jgi:hypothetical protein
MGFVSRNLASKTAIVGSLRLVLMVFVIRILVRPISTVLAAMFARRASVSPLVRLALRLLIVTIIVCLVLIKSVANVLPIRTVELAFVGVIMFVIQPVILPRSPVLLLKFASMITVAQPEPRRPFVPPLNLAPLASVSMESALVLKAIMGILA